MGQQPSDSSACCCLPNKKPTPTKKKSSLDFVKPTPQRQQKRQKQTTSSKRSNKNNNSITTNKLNQQHIINCQKLSADSVKTKQLTNPNKKQQQNNQSLQTCQMLDISGANQIALELQSKCSVHSKKPKRSSVSEKKINVMSTSKTSTAPPSEQMMNTFHKYSENPSLKQRIQNTKQKYLQKEIQLHFYACESRQQIPPVEAQPEQSKSQEVQSEHEDTVHFSEPSNSLLQQIEQVTEEQKQQSINCSLSKGKEGSNSVVISNPPSSVHSKRSYPLQPRDSINHYKDRNKKIMLF